MLPFHRHSKRFIDQVFLGCHDIGDITESSGIKRLCINMHMDSAALVCQGTMLFQFPNNFLNGNNVFIATDWTYHLCPVFHISIYPASIYLPFCVNTAIAHKFPLTPLRVNGCIGIVIGSQIFDSSSKILCRYLSRFRTGNAGHLNLNAKFLLL